MKLALALALLPGVSAQQQHMLGVQGPTIALDRFAGFDTGAGPLSDAELPAAARTLAKHGWPPVFLFLQAPQATPFRQNSGSGDFHYM